MESQALRRNANKTTEMPQEQLESKPATYSRMPARKDGITPDQEPSDATSSQLGHSQQLEQLERARGNYDPELSLAENRLLNAMLASDNQNDPGQQSNTGKRRTTSKKRGKGRTASISIEEWDQRIVNTLNLVQPITNGSDTSDLRKLSSLYMRRGEKYSRLRQHKQSIHDFDEAIKILSYAVGFIRPTISSGNQDLIGQWSYAHAQRGTAHAALRLYEEALGDFSEVIRADPKWFDYRARGRIYQALGQEARAKEDFKQASRLHNIA